MNGRRPVSAAARAFYESKSTQPPYSPSVKRTNQNWPSDQEWNSTAGQGNCNHLHIDLGAGKMNEANPAR